MEAESRERREEENHTKAVKTHRMAERKVFLYHTCASLALEKTGAGDKAWEVTTTTYTMILVAAANNYYVSYVP